MDAEPDPGHPTKRLGLRIDVDTHEGMGLGVPRLLDVLAEHGVRGTFYLSMGPDRSGLAVLNLLRPGFLAKMRRTGAARVYGLRTVLSGTLLPARPIATAFPAVARRIVDEGHEVGVHAWDHRHWQDRLLRMTRVQVTEQLERGRAAFACLLGRQPTTYAAPAWLSNDVALELQESFGLEYASDCRGSEPFLPIVAGRNLRTPQLPTTLPTLDEAFGEWCAGATEFFEQILEAVGASAWPVLTIHAELEGGPYANDFARFLVEADKREVRVIGLRDLLAERRATGVPLPALRVGQISVRGRHGTVLSPLTD